MRSARRGSSPPPILTEEELVDRSLCEDDFSWFLQRFWKETEGEPLEWNWHMDAYCDHAQAFVEDEIDFFILNGPPRTGKSRPFSIYLTPYDWIRRPKRSWLMAAKTDKLTTEFSIAARRLIQCPLFQRYWGHEYQLDGHEYPGLWLADDRNLTHEYDNNQNGKRMATSWQSSIIGSGGHVLGMDDPHNPLDSPGEIDKAVAKYNKEFIFRLSNQNKAKIFLVAQRVAPNDLSGWLLANDRRNIVHLCLPSRFDSRRKCSTIIGWEDPRKKDGELIHPERIGPQAEQALRDAAGDQAAGQLDQDPIPPGGLIFKAGLDETFDVLVAEEMDFFITSLDAAYEGEESSDYGSGHLMAKRDKEYFIIAQMWGQMDFPTLCDEYEEFIGTWDGILKEMLLANVVEKASNGYALLQTYRNKISKLDPFSPRTKKTKRFHVASKIWAAKQVKLPAQGAVLVVGGKKYKLDTHWVLGFKNELKSVPKVKNDDRADSSTQGLLWFEDPDNIPTEGHGETVEPEVDAYAPQMPGGIWSGF